MTDTERQLQHRVDVLEQNVQQLTTWLNEALAKLELPQRQVSRAAPPKS